MKRATLSTEDQSSIKEQLSLENVDNTSDADKPISTVQQSALDEKGATLFLPEITSLNVSDGANALQSIPTVGVVDYGTIRAMYINDNTYSGWAVYVLKYGVGGEDVPVNIYPADWDSEINQSWKMIAGSLIDSNGGTISKTGNQPVYDIDGRLNVINLSATGAANINQLLVSGNSLYIANGGDSKNISFIGNYFGGGTGGISIPDPNPSMPGYYSPHFAITEGPGGWIGLHEIQGTGDYLNISTQTSEGFSPLSSIPQDILEGTGSPLIDSIININGSVQLYSSGVTNSTETMINFEIVVNSITIFQANYILPTGPFPDQTFFIPFHFIGSVSSGNPMQMNISINDDPSTGTLSCSRVDATISRIQ